MQPLNTLFARIASDDEKAFDEVFYNYSSRLRRYVLRVLKEEPVADEIVQDVLLKLWLQREKLPSIGNPSAWLYRIAYNGCLNHIRNKTNETKLMEELESHLYSQESLVEEQLQAKQLQALIQQGIAALPKQCRIIYTMSKEQHLSRKQIAQQLDISENAVRNQLASSVKFLREYIAKHAGIYLPLLLFTTILY